MREATLTAGAPPPLPTLLIIFTACVAAASSAYPQIYVVCKEPQSYICQAWPLLPEFKQQVHDWVVKGMGPCALVDTLPVALSSSPNPIKTLGGGEIEIDCTVVVIAGEEKIKREARVRREAGVPPRGRYRGQTQSQYLAIDHGGKEEGKAEAHSAADSSRASVSGNSGMGQAQSQSVYDPSCDDCYDGKNVDAANLKKEPYDVPNGRGEYGTGQYGSPGWTGSSNGVPIKNSFSNKQNTGPGLGGSGPFQPGNQNYDKHYRGPGESTFAPGGVMGPVPSGNNGLGTNQDTSQQGAATGKEPGTFQTDPLSTTAGVRVGPSVTGFGPTQQDNRGYNPNTQDKQGSALGPEHEGALYNRFGPGRVGTPRGESYPPGSLINPPSGRGLPGQGVIGTDDRPIQNGYGTGSPPGLYSPSQNSAFVPRNGPAQSGSRNVSPDSQEPNGIYNVNQGNNPGALDGANQLGDPGRHYSPGSINLGVEGTGQPNGNWPVASFIPGTSPYFCCVVGPDGNILPAGGLPYNREHNINGQYPSGNIYDYTGRGINTENTGQNNGLGITPTLQTSYGVADPRYGVNNLGQGPESSKYGPTSGSGISLIPGQLSPNQIEGNYRPAPNGANRDNSDYAIQNVPNNYMQGPGPSDVSGGYKPGSNLQPGIVGYNPSSLAGRVGGNNYDPSQSGISKQGSTPGMNGNFNSGQGSLGGIGTFTPGYVEGLGESGKYKPGYGGNIYGPGQGQVPGSHTGYSPQGIARNGNTGFVPIRNDGTGINNGYNRPDVVAPGGISLNLGPDGGENGFNKPGQNAGSFGPSSTGSYAPYHLRGSYGPGLISGNYGPGQISENFIPGQNVGNYGPNQASSNYRPGQASGTYGPDQARGSYGPGQTSGNNDPGLGIGRYDPGQIGGYVPEQSSTYGPGQTSRNYGPVQTTGVYSPGQISRGYSPGQTSGSYTPGQTSGSYTPGQTSGNYSPGQTSGSYSPGQTSGSYRPGQTSGIYSPGQISGTYSPGQGSSSYGPSGHSGGYSPTGPNMGPNLSGSPGSSTSYRPGGSGFEGYAPNKSPGDQKFGDGNNLSNYGQGGGSPGSGQNNISGGGDYLTQQGVNPGTQEAYGPRTPGVGGYLQNQGRPGDGYGSVGRPGDNGRFNINEPFYGSDKYGGVTIGNGHDPRLIEHTSNYGVPQNFTDLSTLADGDDSAAEASVSQGANGTTASATSSGGNDKSRAQTNVHGTYTGSGSFSAQALITGENKEAESEVTGGKKGASSSAQGSGRNNKSQANVQLGSETGSVQTQSLTNGAYHSSNSQVQGSVKGGMADAQARGPGSTSSQAQIGFTPYKDGDKSHDLQKVPFVGGGLASAQSSGRTGQSQSQLHGTFKYGITYNGAAQAGASINKDAVFSNRLSFDKIDVFDEKERNINVDTEKPTTLDILPSISTTQSMKSESSKEAIDRAGDETPTESALVPLNTEDENEKEDETLKNSESRYTSHTHLDHHKTSDEAGSSPVSASVTRSFQPSYGNSGAEYEYTTDREEVQPDEYDTEGQEEEQGEYVNYDEIPRDTLTHQSLQSPRSSLDVRQSTGGNTQHIILGSLKNHDAEITQRNSERPDESKTYQPGEKVPGTGGYTIPIGFTGSVKSVASKDKTYVVGSKESPSQAQTVTLTPGSGRVKYSYPSPNYGRVEAGKLRSLTTGPRDDRYVSVSKSVARDLDAGDNVRKQYSHSYYTKSSSCGFFTFTCTMVSGVDGKKKVCRPKIPTNPDGTPIRC